MDLWRIGSWSSLLVSDTFLCPAALDKTTFGAKFDAFILNRKRNIITVSSLRQDSLHSGHNGSVEDRECCLDLVEWTWILIRITCSSVSPTSSCPWCFNYFILLTSGWKSHTSCWIVLRLNVFLLQFLLGFGCCICHLQLVKLLVVRPKWTSPCVGGLSSLAIEVSLVSDWLLAQVTHHRSTSWPGTHHLVAALLFKILDLALVAFPHHGLAQLLLNFQRLVS